MVDGLGVVDARELGGDALVLAAGEAQVHVSHIALEQPEPALRGPRQRSHELLGGAEEALAHQQVDELAPVALE